MKALVIAAALLCFSAPPVMASDEPAETPGEAAREGLEALMRAMELLIDNIPQYELPELLPNGDIIIRRVPTEGGDEEEGDEDTVEETRT